MTDTVFAAPVQALVVEVRGPTGALVPHVPHVQVQFAAQTPAPRARPYQVPVFVCPITGTCGPDPTTAATAFPAIYPFRSPNVAVDTTDTNGRAKASVRLGSLVGPTYIVVTVPAFGFGDTVPYTVQPGSPRAV